MKLKIILVLLIMPGFLIFILELTLLYFLSRAFIQKLFIRIYRFTHDKETAIGILGWIFLPGTFVHEISHFITALFLLVPVGQVSLMPEDTNDGVKLGSVAIGKADFIRGSLIGLAPLIFGGAILFFLISFTISYGKFNNPGFVALLVYSIFEITNTMFSSRRDLFAVLELVVFLAIISGFLIYLKFYTPFTFVLAGILKSGPIFEKFSLYLLIPVLIELVFLLI